jgi:hypothetical protein
MKRNIRRPVGVLCIAAALLVLGLGVAAVVQVQLLTKPAVELQWSSGSSLYLTGRAGVDVAPICDINPERGPSRSVTVPAQDSRRGLDLRGRLLESWFTGTASVRCSADAILATQPWPIGYRIAEHSWLAIPAVVLGIVGWILLPTRRRKPVRQ